jgi:phage-related minor tail protein
MAKNEAKIKFTAETGEFNKEIQKANNEMSELRAELRLNETQMKDTGATVEGLEKKHSILEQQLKASENKTEALNQKVQKAVKIFGEDSQEVSKLKTQLSNAQNEQERLRQAVNSCADALEEQKKSTEAVNDGFAKLGDTMSDLATGGFVAVAGAVGAVGVVAGKTANDIDKATNDFIAKTGESAKEAEKFEDVMVNIYNGNYGESFEDISEAMSTVKTSMGDIGTAELENLTTQALVLRDTFDMDVNESIRAVNSLMDQFGLTGDEAYSLIAQGAQNGLNQNGDLLDVVNEYSVQFKNAGYGAEDMFNMLANGVDAGTWSVDKLGDAVKEFNIRASDGTVSEAIKENAKAFGLSKTEAKNLAAEIETGSVESYKKLADTLRGVDDDTQRYQLGVSLFGTMWEDLGEDAVLAMLDTQGEISTTKNALDEINAVKYDDLGSAFEGIKRNLENSVAEPIKENVMPAVNEFVEDVDWQGVGDTIGQVFGVVVEGAIALVNAVKESVQWMQEHKEVVALVATAVGVLATAITAYNIVQGVKNAMDAANVTTVWALVSAHIAQAAAAIAAIAPYVLIVAAIAAVIAIIVLLVKNWDTVVEAVKKCWEAVKETLSKWGSWINDNVIQPIVDFFKGLWDGIVNIFKSIIDWVKNNWKSIVAFLINPFAGVFNYFYTNFEGFRNFIDNVVKSVKQFFVDMWNGIKSSVNSIVNWVKNAWNTIKNATSTAFNAVKSTVSNIWNGIRTAISNVVNKVKSTVSNIWNGIKSTTSSVFNSVRSTVSAVWNRIKTAITNPIETAKNKIKGIVDTIKGFFKNMKISLPKIKLPHFKITGKLSLSPPSVPKLKIDWYKDGGIFVKPTIFSTATGLKGVGEAGAEAVLPIDRLEGYISNAIEKAQTIVNLDSVAEAIKDLANRPNVFRVGDRDIAIATASANDSVNGLRSTLKGRGLALD